jgi:hypothetical protein
MALSEESERESIERGNEAKTILGSQVWADAWDAIDGALLDKWRASRQTEERDELWRYCQITLKLRIYFEDVIENGKLAREQLSVLRERDGLMERLRSTVSNRFSKIN